jgi:hypothetical protein
MTIQIDFAKAQVITKDRLRAERAPLLAALDIEFQRAVENGAEIAAIVAEKNRLRDITNQVDAATTLDDLKALSCAAPVVEPVVEAAVEAETPAEATVEAEQPIEGEA